MQRHRSRWLSLPLGLVAAALCAVSVLRAQTVFVYRGELSQPSQSAEDTWFKEVELGDVDGDGWLDLVLPQKQPWNEAVDPEPPAGSNIDHLYLNSPGLVLSLHTPSAWFGFQPTVGTFPTAITTVRNYDVEIGDLDLDGHLDIVRPDRRGRLVVLWGAGDGTFPQWTDVLSPSFGGNPNDECAPPFSVEDGNYDDVDLADLDGDGDLDVAVAQYDTCGRSFLVENLRVFSLGMLPRSFQIRGVSPDELPAELTHSVSFGDVDQDGATDVLLANQFNSSRKPQLYLGSGQPFDFLPNPIELPSPGINSETTTVADLVDLNGDGRLDVYIAQGVFSTPAVPTHGVYFHSGSDATPYPAMTPWPEADPFSRALYDARYGDLDDDGNVEIVAVSINTSENGTVFGTEIHVASVLPGDQLVDVSASFLPPQLWGGIAVDLGDLDQDGDDDMVLGGTSADPSGIYSAAHVYENRTFTHLHDATVLTGTFLALKELRADTALLVPSGENVTLEAGETVVLGDGFTAAAGSELVARILP